MPSVAAGYPKGYYGVGLREQLYPGEETYFKANPNVAGMAAEDDRIILNPYSKLSPTEKNAVMMNEAARVHMRRGLVEPPRFDLTPEQEKAFATYGDRKPDTMRQTLAARILSGDPSALTPTADQLEYVQRLRQFMGTK
jgi:hypothetical protein